MGKKGEMSAITHYTCERCRTISLKWSMKCRTCGAFKALVQMREAHAAPGTLSSNRTRGPVTLSSIKNPDLQRFSLGLPDLDRVLGGGAVRGSAVLLGGEPGAGKSTLLLQALSAAALAGERVLYVSGEETEEQIANRADRLGGMAPELLLFAEKDLDTILEIVEHERPACLIVDSVQTLYAPGIDGVQGGVVQVKHATALLVDQAKRLKCCAILVCHITKGQDFAGPKTLEHLVDTVMFIELMATGDRRKLFASKNRFGSTAEVAIFDMHEHGLCGVV